MASDPTTAVLLAIGYLVLKHTVADFFLQTPYQYLNKGIYGHPGGILHSGIHMALTIPVFLILPTAMLKGVLILIGEFVVHYHVDWLKERGVRLNGYTPQTAGFWMLMGVDQMAHYLTYLAIVAILIRHA
ncbi:MAG: DUF3307 domain-containing protein [Pseudomonadota bacterium]|nr:DUF3307 domain-containing protein [Pseudomonadota bacterium]